LNDFTPLQGGEPIVVDGQLIGAIGVSGAASADQDEELAIAGAKALSADSASMFKNSSSAVTYFDKDRVAAAFTKGMPLIEIDNYKVHASHREAAGMVEIHVKDTDIIYVLDGKATFITGGTMVDGKTTAPDEIRGASINGGETRQLVKGDVIIVPNGVPH